MAALGNILITCVPTPSGTVTTKYRNGDDSAANPPSTPQLGQPSVRNSTSADIPLVTASTGGTAPRAYELSLSTTSGIAGFAVVDADADFSGDGVYSLMGLTASTAYWTRLACVDADGRRSGYSGTFTFTTVASGGGDVTAPTPPSNLVATSTTAGQASLTWTNGEDAVGIAFTDILRGTSIANVPQNDGAVIYELAGTGSSYTDVSAVSGSEVFYRVRHRDAAGNASAYSSRYVVTIATAPSGTRKWTPGHYFLVNAYGSDALLSKRITYYDVFAAESCITGVVLRIKNWGLLETTEGNYQAGYNLIDAEIAALSARGLKLIIMLSPSEFSTQPFTPESTLVPAYIKTAPYAMTGGFSGNEGGLVAGATSWYANLRYTPVVDRWIALIQALGTRYDSNQTVEAVLCTEESSVPSNTTYPYPGNRTANEFRDATLTEWRRIGRAARLAFPNTLVTVMANYCTDRLDDLLADAETYGYGIGGPDLYPNPYVYPGGSLHSLPGATRVYMGLDGGNIPAKDYRGILFYSDQNQSPVYANKEGAYLPEEIRQQMVNVQRQSHCMWVRMWTPTNQAAFDRTDITWAAYQTAVHWQTGIIPVLRANPATVTTIPTRAFPPAP